MKLGPLKYIFSPFQTLNYYVTYFKLIEQIVRFENRQIIRQVKLLKILVFITFLHFLYLAFVPSQNLERFLHFDGLYLLLPKMKINLMCANACLMILYCSQYLLAKPDLQLNMLFRDILFNRKTAKFFVWKKFRGKLIYKRVQVYFLVMLNVFNSLVWVTGWYIV